MAWDFETHVDFQRKLDWVDALVKEEIEPVDVVLGDLYNTSDQTPMAVIRPAAAARQGRGAVPRPTADETGGAPRTTASARGLTTCKTARQTARHQTWQHPPLPRGARVGRW
jgi:hypothetical protein